MKLVLDFETTSQKVDNKIDPTPYNALNYAVSVGYKEVGSKDVTYLYFQHNDVEPSRCEDSFSMMEEALSKCTLLIAHNAKFDYQWLQSMGINYEGDIWCTQIGEYILHKGLKKPLKLSLISEARDLTRKRTDLTMEYLKKGVGFEAMPEAVVTEYGIGDVNTTEELYLAQVADYALEENISMVAVRDMSFEFCRVLSHMEMDGIAIDLDELKAIEDVYVLEQEQLRADLQTIVREVMGDTPINLNSPEQLSSVVYSRQVTDKNIWAETFNLGKEERGAVIRDKRRPRMNAKVFANAVKTNTTVVRKTKATKCQSCSGTGKEYKEKKDGTPYKKFPKCTDCGGVGIAYRRLAQAAGLKMQPSGVNEVAGHGFSTSKEQLESLSLRARDSAAMEFFAKITRLNAVNVYLSTFIGGIRKGIKSDGLLHTNFNQTTVSTGRLSSTNPNFQNLPKGYRFPVRKCIVSRFEGGSIADMDASQLEYRAAVEMSGDKVGLQDILNGVDVHALTKDVIGCSRDDAKADTFKPLYGGSFGTPTQMAYYKAFLDKHQGILAWHGKLQDDAIRYKVIQTPSGRQYAFPNATRQSNGGSSFATQIKNYPVQGFATGDIIPCAIIPIWWAIRRSGLRSVLFLTVHDNVAVDVYPGEEKAVQDILSEHMGGVAKEIERRFNYVMTVPLGVELAMGPNWMDLETVYKN